MAKYHQFLKFLAKKHCFRTKRGSTTFFGTRAHQTRVPYFLFRRGTMTWKAGIKKLRLVLELHGLEYCLVWYQAHEARVLYWNFFQWPWERQCFYNAKEDQKLALAITAALVELGKLDILLNNDSLLFREARWKVHAMHYLLLTWVF